ncbi:Phytoene/squalene synthetase [Ceraceosorus bombacis]|uniref:Phytoene/squalene synthetase n=1 Tax=Ceraceosorus bombacis TaxID=401625 RepID=A0A0P1BIJ0_9BASI|nr:Phytoene/squalene synthetase [Ceraceosorus bombacis]
MTMPRSSAFIRRGIGCAERKPLPALASHRTPSRRLLSHTCSVHLSSSSPLDQHKHKLTPAESCAQLVAQRDHPSNLSARFYPAHLRRHFLAIRAFNVETASVKDNVSNPTLGRIRVGWWRDAVRGAFDNKATQHPTVEALRDAIHDPAVLAHGGLMEDHFIRIIDARENDVLAPSVPPLLSEIESYSEGTASRLHPTPTTPQSGAASRIPISASQRRISLPREYLGAHNVVEEQVFRLGPKAHGLQDAVFDTATRANDYFISARKEIEGLQGGRIPDEVVGVLLSSVNPLLFLRQLEKVDFDVFDPSLQQVATGRGWKLPWEMWKVRRRGNI